MEPRAHLVISRGRVLVLVSLGIVLSASAPRSWPGGSGGISCDGEESESHPEHALTGVLHNGQSSGKSWMEAKNTDVFPCTFEGQRIHVQEAAS